MALVRSTSYDFPELWKRFFAPDFMGNWMRTEEFVDGDTLVVRAELPGLDPDKNVELTISHGALHIRAEREEKSEKKSKDGYRSEFHYGSFQRDIPLPVGTKDEDVKASYVDGILEVRVPLAKAKEASTKVPVTRAP
ncbi:MAG TPA: Hsp20/alpha crystallin family protein [Acidimicrobiales bacterium]|nr:Hsp20/alpha crystallin family protein [Acidimicrobiales bacterium]